MSDTDKSATLNSLQRIIEGYRYCIMQYTDEELLLEHSAQCDIASRYLSVPSYLQNGNDKCDEILNQEYLVILGEELERREII